MCTNVSVLGRYKKAFHLTFCALFDCSTLQKLKTATEGHQLQGKRCQEDCRKKSITQSLSVCKKKKGEQAALLLSVPQINIKLHNQ